MSLSTSATVMMIEQTTTQIYPHSEKVRLEDPPPPRAYKPSANAASLRQVLGQIFRPSPARINRSLRRIGYAFLPQLLRSYIYHDYAPVERKRSTSWLDGMRGYAAIIIFNFHFLFAFTDMSQRPWGDENHRYFVELPIIRIVHSQMPPYIFFMAAGYSLSVKALQLMRTNDSSSRDKLLQVLSGSAFRRIVRLILPTLSIMLIVSLLTYVGLFEHARPYVADPKKNWPGHPARAKKPPPQFDNLYDQLHFIRAELSSLLNFFTWHHFYPQLNGALWTIRVEVRGSMMMYAILLLLAQAKEYVRLAGFLVCMFYCLRWEKMEEVSYFWGAAVAQMSVMRQSSGGKGDLLKFEDTGANRISLLGFSQYRPALAEISSSPKLRFRLIRFLFTVACIAGPFYLMTCPMNKSEEARGYVWLTKLTPEVVKDRGQFISLVGNCLLVWIYSYCTPGSGLFTAFANDFALYLGQNMFAIYLIHSPLFHLYGYALPHVFWYWMGDKPNESTFVYVTGLAAGWFLTAIPTLWLADVFTREVIVPAFKTAFWLESVCYAKSG